MSVTIKSERYKGKTYNECTECGKKGIEWVTASDFSDSYWVEFKQCRYCGHILPEQKQFDFGKGEWVKGEYRKCFCHKCRVERGECHCHECTTKQAVNAERQKEGKNETSNTDELPSI